MGHPKLYTRRRKALNARLNKSEAWRGGKRMGPDTADVHGFWWKKAKS
jgi:hypothetical protein